MDKSLGWEPWLHVDVATKKNIGTCRGEAAAAGARARGGELSWRAGAGVRRRGRPGRRRRDLGGRGGQTTGGGVGGVRSVPRWEGGVKGGGGAMRCHAAAVFAAGAAAVAAALGLAAGEDGGYLEMCQKMNLDFIVLEGEATLKAIEDDIAADLAKVGITVNTRLLPKEEFNEAMVSGDFNMAFSESWGAPYDPQAFAASWATPDEAYYAALSGLPEPYTQEKLGEMIQAALTQESEPAREQAWTEILSALHEQATELPFAGKRIPAVFGNRLAGYAPGHQQFDYPAHTLKVQSGPRAITVAPGAQTGLFNNETGVGRLDAHSYRPNEFFANNWVYDGLVEYGAGGQVLPALAASWTVTDRSGRDGQEYTFKLREGVEFHDGAAWNCSVAQLNFDHVLAPPLTTADWHGWYGLPGQIDGWSCADNFTLVVTTKDKYYPLLQELSFIRPLRMMSPNMFVGGLESDPLTQNSCPVGWGNVTDSGITVICAGIIGGGVNEGGTVSGTGRWKYVEVETDDDGLVKEVHFTINDNHWDAPSGNHVTQMVVVSYPSHASVKAALLDGSLDAVLGAGVLTEVDVVELKNQHAGKLTVAMSEAIQNRIVVLNTAKAPTDELQVRKIIIHAVDKTSIIKKELAGLAETADSLFPKDAPYSSAVLTPIPDYDFEKAKLLNCPTESSGSSGLSSGAIAAIAVLGTIAGAGLISLAIMYRREKAGNPVFQPLISNDGQAAVEI